MRTANRSGFMTHQPVLVSESPSDAALRDITSGSPCRTCFMNGETSHFVGDLEEGGLDIHNNCFKYDKRALYRFHTTGEYSIAEMVCRSEWEKCNRHSKTVALFDRDGVCILKAYEERN